MLHTFKNEYLTFYGGALALLRFDKVSKVYKGGNKAVNDLTVHFKKGEFICFIGPSSCRKTTTMKMINRLIEPTSGTIYLNGEDIMKKDPVKLRREIGYVIQQIGLFPHMTIEENICLVLKLLKWPEEKRRKRAEELIRIAHPKFRETLSFEAKKLGILI